MKMRQIIQRIKTNIRYDRICQERMAGFPKNPTENDYPRYVNINLTIKEAQELVELIEKTAG